MNVPTLCLRLTLSLLVATPAVAQVAQLEIRTEGDDVLQARDLGDAIDLTWPQKPLDKLVKEPRAQATAEAASASTFDFELCEDTTDIRRAMRVEASVAGRYAAFQGKLDAAAEISEQTCDASFRFVLSQRVVFDQEILANPPDGAAQPYVKAVQRGAALHIVFSVKRKDFATHRNARVSIHAQGGNALAGAEASAKTSLEEAIKSTHLWVQAKVIAFGGEKTKLQAVERAIPPRSLTIEDLALILQTAADWKAAISNKAEDRNTKTFKLWVITRPGATGAPDGDYERFCFLVDHEKEISDRLSRARELDKQEGEQAGQDVWATWRKSSHTLRERHIKKLEDSLAGLRRIKDAVAAFKANGGVGQAVFPFMPQPVPQLAIDELRPGRGALVKGKRAVADGNTFERHLNPWHQQASADPGSAAWLPPVADFDRSGIWNDTPKISFGTGAYYVVDVERLDLVHSIGCRATVGYFQQLLQDLWPLDKVRRNLANIHDGKYYVRHLAFNEVKAQLHDNAPWAMKFELHYDRLHEGAMRDCGLVATDVYGWPVALAFED